MKGQERGREESEPSSFSDKKIKAAKRGERKGMKAKLSGLLIRKCSR